MSQINNAHNENIEESINFYQQLLTLKREYKLLISTTFLVGTIGFFKAISVKPIWKGEFQIVISNDEKGGVDTNAFEILKGNSDYSDDLLTEINIISSPIVLMPVFNLYNEISERNNKNVRFKDWAAGVEIELLDGTKVLNVSYVNENKDLLIPVLKEISEQYQDYSKKDSKLKIENQLIYLNSQIDKYLKKSKTSLKNAQTFAINNNLTALEGDADIDTEIRNTNGGINQTLSLFSQSKNPSNISGNSSLNIEAERIKAANQKKFYETKLAQLKDLKDKNELFLVGRTDQFAGSSNIVSQIAELDIEIEILRANFTEKDEELIKALKLKETYLNIFKNDLYGYLNAQLMDAEARMKASERPEGVLVKYRELVRESNRDEQFLTKLEFERQLALMKKAMIINPWELISKPQVLDRPVSKSKRVVLMLWTAFGLALGTTFCFIKEKIDDFVFNKDKLLNSVPYKLLAILELKDKDYWEKEISTPLDLSGINLKDNVINLIPLGDVSELNILKIENVFKKISKSNIVQNLNLIREPKDINILILENRKIKNKEIETFLEKVDTYNLKINYWLLID